MEDNILAALQQAETAATSEPAKSRELSLVITKIQEAVLWRQFDLLKKKEG